MKMTREEAIFRVKTGNFNNGFGFDMRLVIDAVGILGEMFRNKQLIEVTRCKNCAEYKECEIYYGERWK